MKESTLEKIIRNVNDVGSVSKKQDHQGGIKKSTL